MKLTTPKFTRRVVVAGMAATAAMPQLGLPAIAAPDDMQREIGKLIGSATVKVGRVKVVMPDLTENGNSTSVSIKVDSPMSATDYVKALHIFSEKNPVAYIARLGLSPRSGRADVSTSIRVADSQQITVIAEMNDGSFWSGQAATEVTTPACIDDSDRPN